MPEGDSVLKLARALGPELRGVRLSRVTIEGQEARDFAGAVVDEIWAAGKHLFIAAGTLAIRTHLGMHGTWHRYYEGDAWQLPRSRASVVLVSQAGADGVACTWVLFRAKEAELVDLEGTRHRAFSRRLGPDLLGPVHDASVIADALARARRVPPETPLADVLLDQRIAAGIGNVWKSELCFLEGVHPSTAIGDVTDAMLESLYVRAREMLARNIGPAMRSTRGPSPHAPHTSTGRPSDDARYWVYRRGGEPCCVCGTPIEYARIGRPPRATFWCSRCQ